MTCSIKGRVTASCCWAPWRSIKRDSGACHDL
jgi:hypothetical protein